MWQAAIARATREKEEKLAETRAKEVRQPDPLYMPAQLAVNTYVYASVALTCGVVCGS